jgi:predicted RNA-binding Zn-ribbon protein involved in translation (DUF1610 family)
MKHRVCTSCGFVGKPINQCFGSFLVDAFIWATVGSFALMTGLIPVLLIPAAWTLYHLAKFGTTKCPECGNLDMVSMESRKGREALNPSKITTTVWTRGDEATAKSYALKDAA